MAAVPRCCTKKVLVHETSKEQSLYISGTSSETIFPTSPPRKSPACIPHFHQMSTQERGPHWKRDTIQMPVRCCFPCRMLRQTLCWSPCRRNDFFFKSKLSWIHQNSFLIKILSKLTINWRIYDEITDCSLQPHVNWCSLRCVPACAMWSNKLKAADVDTGGSCGDELHIHTHKIGQKGHYGSESNFWVITSARCWGEL